MAKIRRQFSFSLICVVVFFSLAAFSFSQDEQPTKGLGVLKEITFSKTMGVLDVKLIIDTYSFHRVFELMQPKRIVIDLYSIGDILAEPLIEINDFKILRIRHGMFQRGVARIVFDIEEDFPFYGIERMPEGLKITFSTKKGPSDDVPVPEEIVKEEIPEKPLVKIEEEKKETWEQIEEVSEKKAVEVKTETKENPETVPQEPPIKDEAEKTEEVIDDPAGTIEEQLAETKAKLFDTTLVLNQLKEERLKQKKKFIRVLVTGNYFSPREGNLKTVYKKGTMFGAEINVGIMDFVEIWFAENYFSKTVTDTVSETEKKVYLIPIELGLKVRLNKGNVNPYFGIGGGYFQYKEKTSDGEIREQNIGFIGQSGLFFKINGFFIVDIYAHFKYCPITTAAERFDVGGFHFGLGLGFEF